jgi:hypothetical protein
MRFSGIMSDGTRLPCVVFRDADTVERELLDASGTEVDIVGNISARMWNGSRTIQMTVEDATVPL